MSRPLKTYVDLEAIKHNYLLAKTLHPDNPAFAVVKANAYGHGASHIAIYLDEIVDAFAVASIDEALELRLASVHSPILLLEGTFEASEFLQCQENRFWVAIENTVQLDDFLKSDAVIEKIFVKIDSGMHRLGISPIKVDGFVATLKATDRVKEIVLMTHFSSADNLQSLATQDQLACFESACDTLSDLSVSVANSAATLKWSVPKGSWLRPGLMLYGISPFENVTATELGLKPAMSFVSRIISLRTVLNGEGVGYSQAYEAKGDRTIATVAVGYGDGYPRTLDFDTPVIINNEICTLAGRVSMDMITVDVSHLKNVQIGDDVLLWGDGNPVENVAQHANTIGYELVTRMTGRSIIKYT